MDTITVPLMSVGFMLSFASALLTDHSLNNSVVPLLISNIFLFCLDHNEISGGLASLIALGVLFSIHASMRPLFNKIKYKGLEILVSFSFIIITAGMYFRLFASSQSYVLYILSSALSLQFFYVTGIDELELSAFGTTCMLLFLLVFEKTNIFGTRELESILLSIATFLCILFASVIVYIFKSLLGWRSSSFKIFAFLILTLSLTIVFFPYSHAVIGENFVSFVFGLIYQHSIAIGIISIYWILIIALSSYIAAVVMNKFHWSKIWGRKIFHFAVVLILIPPLLLPELHSFLVLSLGGVLCVFSMLEFARILAIPSELNAVTSYFNQFLVSTEITNEKEPVIVAHFSLVVACTYSIWTCALLSSVEDLSSRYIRIKTILPFVGVLCVGVGDSMAAVVGSNFGKKRWRGQNKTYLGSMFGFLSLFLSMLILAYVLNCEHLTVSLLLASGVTTLGEVFISGNDNFTLPVVFMYSMLFLNF